MQMEGMSGGTYYGVLHASDVDFANITQVETFLHELKHLEYLPILGARYAEYFWYGIIVLLVAVAVINRVYSLVRRLRFHPSITQNSYLAKIALSTLSTITALAREPSYLQWTPRALSPWFMLPPFGPIYIILAYFVFIIILEFINNKVAGAGYWQFLGVRAGWLATAQIPLLVALAGKRNLIGMLCGIPYVRLNIYHRWVSRGLLLLSTFHFAFQNHGWDLYHISKLEWDTDDCPTKGIAAYAFILWMNLTTLAPFRHMSYEFFVVQHIITFFGFIIALSYHLDTGPAPNAQRYIYVTAGIYVAGLILRFVYYSYINSRPARATLEPLEGGATKVRITARKIRNWKPGSHILLSIPRLGLQLSHPATISSIPTSHDGELVLILKAHKGFTRKLINRAEAITNGPKDAESIQTKRSYTALIDGPYASSSPDFTSFDSVLFLAGGTGVTFTLSQLLQVAHRSTDGSLPLRQVLFIWVIKESRQASWALAELEAAMQKLQNTNIQIRVKIFVTQDSVCLPDIKNNDEKQTCACTNPCLCTPNNNYADDTDDIDKIEQITPSSPCTEPDSVLEASGPPRVSFKQGRPSFDGYIEDAVLQAKGEIAVAVCGPIGLTVSVRQAVVRVSDHLAVCKGSGLPGVFLHVENVC
ncbi:ferric reductase NAD binding domain-domain-containing protein [Aspergillus welwitschiae]|uniref:ferric-chelate reductase (NADPH) n=1 Tax=Aspergillus welwitschiae TaxID=1341132 RepID=A0A3F3PRY3_9EURO|nr:ferric reductase NAD binding domain-domain-containing protein [Aspergillus welwitschiae]RDH29695.1 ferric reductase NAD binding domain-domain-containing protein [Aspergillus welwitschiae]